MCGSILHMWTKISDDWSKTMTCIVENVTISFKHEYWRLNLTSGCDIMSDVSSVNNTFSVRICDYLFISDVKLSPEVSPEVEYVTVEKIISNYARKSIFITSEAPNRNQRISRPTCQNQILLDELSKWLFSSRWLNICLHRSHPSQVAAHPGGRPQEGLPRPQEGSPGPWAEGQLSLTAVKIWQAVVATVPGLIVLLYFGLNTCNLCIHIEESERYFIYLYAFLIPYNLTPEEWMVK